jgi:hypothetical protein
MLHLDTAQSNEIHKLYDSGGEFHHMYTGDKNSKQEASALLESQGLDLHCLEDLGNGWSTWWSTQGGKGNGKYACVLLQWWDWFYSF